MKTKFYKTIQFQMTLAMFIGVVFIATLVIKRIDSFFEEDQNRAIKNNYSETSVLFNKILNNELKKLSLPLEAIANNPLVIDALANKDREKLKNLFLNTYKNKLKSEYGILQFQFHLPDGSSFLRIHNPNKFGDKLATFRKTIAKVVSSHEKVMGIEIGRAGLGIRAVYPIFKNNRYVGSVELGGSLENVLKMVSEILGVEYALGIKEKYLETSNLLSKQKIAQINQIAFLDFSGPELRNNLSEKVFTTKPQVLKTNGKSIVINPIPVKNFEGENIGWIIFSKDDTAEFNLRTERIKWLVIAIFIVASIMFVAFILIFRLRIIKPINRSIEFTSAISNGEFSSEISNKFNDEIGVLIFYLNGMKERLRELFGSVEQKTKEAEEQAKKSEQMQKEAIKEKEYLSEKTQEMLYAMSKFSNGDLTVQLPDLGSDDEISKLFEGFNNAVKKIRELIIRVREAVEATASAGTEISSSAEQMAAGANELSGQSNEVTSAVEEVTRTILQTSENAKYAAELARGSKEFSLKGVEKINEAKAGMNKIVEASNETNETVKNLAGKISQITTITNVINEITDQTNLLALNAAIEAARAGEHGRGFAVVADEVRKLAERTLQATKQIAEMINSILEETHNAENTMGNALAAVSVGKEKTEEVEKVLHSIMDETTKVENEISNLAEANEQEFKAAEDIAHSMEMMNNITRETNNGIQQIAQATEDLARLSENLRNLISQFEIEKNGKVYLN